ncbi:MAG TPA: PIG-L family deacetylase [Vicinamibacterales bacterium]|nr:PIG-L family deacetylase [Vicinamibacterales bacterium]
MRRIPDSTFPIPHSRGPKALAISAHPDDIEFVMAGTLLLLRDAGWRTHYLNLASGNLGTVSMSSARTMQVRRREAQAAARVLGATWHPPFFDDLEIEYKVGALRRLCAVIRVVAPAVILTHAPEDYMEDHMMTSRLAVTAAFARGMPNFRTIPARPPLATPVTIYHATPHGLRDQLRRPVIAGAYVDTTSVHERKRASLACHASQQEWLDISQGMNSYMRSMEEASLAIGRQSGRFRHAEGWTRHAHLGFCDEHADPLRDALGAKYRVNRTFERRLRKEEAHGPTTQRRRS